MEVAYLQQQKKQQTNSEIGDKKSYESQNKTKTNHSIQDHLVQRHTALNTLIAVGHPTSALL